MLLSHAALGQLLALPLNDVVNLRQMLIRPDLSEVARIDSVVAPRGGAINIHAPLLCVRLSVAVVRSWIDPSVGSVLRVVEVEERGS
jgi:hypothetical protein